MTASATPQDVGGVHLLVSNYNPTLNMAIHCQPDATYPTHVKKTTVEIYGGDDQLGFQGTERKRRGARYTVTLTAGGDPSGHGTGPDAAEALDAIADAPLPYVCVLEPDGARIFAQLTVADISRTPGDLNIVPVEAVPVPGPVVTILE